MSDNYRMAAEWETGLERHKGESLGHLYMKNGSGDVTIAKSFDGLPPIERADILKDVIGLLTREYDKALRDMRPASQAVIGRKDN